MDLGSNLILTKSDLVPESKLVVGEFWKGDGRNKGARGSNVSSRDKVWVGVVIVVVGLRVGSTFSFVDSDFCGWSVKDCLNGFGIVVDVRGSILFLKDGLDSFVDVATEFFIEGFSFHGREDDMGIVSGLSRDGGDVADVDIVVVGGYVLDMGDTTRLFDSLAWLSGGNSSNDLVETMAFTIRHRLNFGDVIVIDKGKQFGGNVDDAGLGVGDGCCGGRKGKARKTTSMGTNVRSKTNRETAIFLKSNVRSRRRSTVLGDSPIWSTACRSGGSLVGGVGMFNELVKRHKGMSGDEGKGLAVMFFFYNYLFLFLLFVFLFTGSGVGVGLEVDGVIFFAVLGSLG